MSPADTERAAAREWAARFSLEGATPPFSFVYDSIPSGQLVPGWACDRGSPVVSGDVETQTVAYTDPVTGLVVHAEVSLYHDLPAVEWVLYLENTGTSDTPIIENIQALDARLALRPEEPCTIHHAKGALCSQDDFAPLARGLRPRGRLDLQPGGGRSSSEVLPFFNVEMGAEGFVVAIGWTGEWAAGFTRAEDGGLRLQAGMELTHLKLYPGERIRTPRLLMLFWQGDRMRGHNLLRRHILAHHRPRPGGEPLVGPLCNGNWGGTAAEVHLDNVRRIIEHDLPFEYYWIDAEWFGGPGHWMEHAGHWEPRPELYPEGFKPISDLLHRSGRKLLLWFEPERVAPGTPWARDHEEWLLEVAPEDAVTWADYGDHLPTSEWVKMESKRNQLNAGDRLLNLGNPDARRFLTDFLSEKITEFGLDCLRQDSNIAQLAYWRRADEPDRQGIAEIRYVQGQYALWDELLERHPGLIIDNCASGGRRIDLESLGRTTPLWRTDYAVGHRDPTASQCHLYGLLLWVPVNGTGSGYVTDCDEYAFRSTMGPALAVGLWGQGDASQGRIPEDYPFDRARRLLREYLDVREYYYGDYYPLTEYSRAEDAWMAYQLHRPDLEDGVVVVLKRPLSAYTRAVFQLRGLRPDGLYETTDLDTGAVSELGGAELMGSGLPVELPGKPDSALLRYRAKRA